MTALNQNAEAYKALAHAAAKQDVSAYGHAEAAVESAGSGLNAAYAQLRQLGYTIHWPARAVCHRPEGVLGR